MGTIVMREMRGIWIAALAVVVGSVAFSLVGPAASQSQSQSQSSGQRQGVAPKPQPKSPALKANVGATPAPEQGARSGEEPDREARERDERAALDRHLVEATAALNAHGLSVTYATIGLIVVSASLWLITFLQARDVRAAVRAVQESSAAARRSAELAQRALVLTQRATVIAGEPKAVWLRDADERLVGCRLLVTWHNVGTTPTKDMIAAVAGLAAEKPPT